MSGAASVVTPGKAEEKPSVSGGLKIAICMLVSVSEGFDLASMGLAGPGMIDGLGLSRSAFGLAATVMMAGFFVGAAMGGMLGDRFGRRRVLVLSMAVVGMFCFLTAQAHDLPSLLAVRFLAGIGIGGVFPNLLVLAADSVPPSGRGRAIALTNCGGSIGGLSAGLLLAFGGAAVGWQIFFLIGAAAPLFIIPLVLLLLPESHSARRSGRPPMSTSSALFGERRATITILFWASNFCTAFMFYLVASWAPTLLADRGLPPSTLGAANAAMAVGAMTGALAFTTLLDKKWLRLPFILAYGGMIIAFAIFAGVATQASAIGSMALIGLTVMGGQLLLYAVAPMLYPVEVRSTGIGWSVAIGRLGAIVSPWAVGAALDAGFGQQDLLWLMIPAIIMAGLCGASALLKSERAIRVD